MDERETNFKHIRCSSHEIYYIVKTRKYLEMA